MVSIKNLLKICAGIYKMSSISNIKRLEQERYNLVMRNGEVCKKNSKLNSEIMAINNRVKTVTQLNNKLDQEIIKLKQEISIAKQNKK